GCASFSGPLNGPELTSKWIISTGQGQTESVWSHVDVLFAVFDAGKITSRHAYKFGSVSETVTP
ncbi:hypothetical protein, partial [Rhizobium leguminosarum]|uniref:hypothetical protein n=1 Tax=Rhizobium leguminosarum TaxID=384 RepID=UPI003F9577EF